VEADTVGGQGGVELDPTRRLMVREAWRSKVQVWSHVGGGEMVVARVRVRAPHT
jgi:hypothetical protein